jgi:hypothetical protein
MERKVTFNDLTPDEQEVYGIALRRLLHLDDDGGQDDSGPCEVCGVTPPNHEAWCPLEADEAQDSEAGELG